MTSAEPTSPAESAPFTMYTTSWCPFCAMLKRDLARAGMRSGVEYAEVDIERDPSVVGIVEAANRGNRTVPTLVFPDGSTMTNPPVEQVLAAVAR